jgi:AcrR family transcriptional regulator
MSRPSIAGARRDQIVWALYACLSRSDFGQVTIKHIAEQAEVAPGIIHHYFTDKDEIYSSLSTAILTQYESLLDEHLDDQPTSADRSAVVLDFIIDQFILDRELNRVFYNLVLKSLENPEVRKPLQALLDRYRGRLHDEFTELPGTAIIAQIEGLALQNLIDPDRFSRQDFLTILRSFLRSKDQ